MLALLCSQWLQWPREVSEWAIGGSDDAVDETNMFDDEDIGVHHTSTSTTTHTNNNNNTQQRLHWPTSLNLPSSSSHSTSSVPFVSKRRAIQFTNRNVDELEGDRIETDHDSDAIDDDIDFTPNDNTNNSNQSEYATYTASQTSRGRPFRRHPTVERSPHCQPLERNVNKPFVCIYPFTLNGRRVGGGSGSGGGGGGEVEGVERGGGGGGSERERCGQEFSTRQACENHIRSRHTYEKLKCSFPNCGFSSTDVQNLNKHEKSHVGRSTSLSMQPRVGEGGLRMKSV